MSIPYKAFLYLEKTTQCKLCLTVKKCFDILLSAKREAVMEIGKPWSNITISRSLSSLKYFYDLKFGM